MKKLILLLALILGVPTAIAQVPVQLSPVAHIQFLDSSGRPLSAGCVSTFNAGTTTPAATYVDSTGTSTNANPIILDAGGFANVWLASQAYKIQVNAAPASGSCSSINLGPLQWTVDNVNAFSLLTLPNTWTQLQTFSGGATVAGNLTSTGTIKCKNLQNIRCVAGFPGSDWGTKVNNADADLGATPGELWIDQSAGTGNATAIVISANHTLRFIQGGTYSSAKNISLGANASIVGEPAGNNVTPVLLQQTTGSNLPAFITFTGGSNMITGITVDGAASVNATGGVGILVSGVGISGTNNSIIQHFPSHGISILSAPAGAQYTFQVHNTIISTNAGDGIYAQNSPDIAVEGGSEIISNGNFATVTTAGTAVHATSGTWSTSSTLVGTKIRINNVLYSVASISDSSHLVLSSSAGAQVGVLLRWGGGIEVADSPRLHVTHTNFNNNVMMGIMGYGTVAGLGASGTQIVANRFKDEAESDIEVIGYDPIGAGNVAFLWNITGNEFLNSTNRNPTNTYDQISLQDGGQHTITANSFDGGVSPNLVRYGIHLSETLPNRALPSYLSANTFGNSSTIPITAITAATEAGNIVTITMAVNPIIVGQTVLIAGVTPAGYNGTFYALTATGTTITYFNPTAGLGAGSIFGTASQTPNFGTATFIDQNANASNGVAGQVQAPLLAGDVICGSATQPPQWSDCSAGINFPISLNSGSQVDTSVGSTTFFTVANTGFYVFGGQILTTADASGVPTVKIGFTAATSALSTGSMTNSPCTAFDLGVATPPGPGTATAGTSSACFFTAGQVVKFLTTVALGGQHITYSVTVFAKQID